MTCIIYWKLLLKQTHVFKNLLDETILRIKFLYFNEVDASSHQNYANNMCIPLELLQIWSKILQWKNFGHARGLPKVTCAEEIFKDLLKDVLANTWSGTF